MPLSKCLWQQLQMSGYRGVALHRAGRQSLTGQKGDINEFKKKMTSVDLVRREALPKRCNATWI